ncbi:MAG: pseudouridine synthase [Gammaproteobacteria bacterium]|nr:MAG: pseudouridine synthase [Gammaproteobacteria bacterium]
MKTVLIEQITQEINALASALSCQGLWTQATPSAQQLASREPFCIDTMTFEQWLQWVFIPQLSDLLKQPSFNGLPNHSDIHPIADYLLAAYPQDTQAITATIKKIDELLNQFTPTAETNA